MSNITKRDFNNFGLFDPFFDDFFDEKRNYSGLMKTDIKDEGNSYLMKIDMPEIKKENIKISLDNGYLNSSASASDSQKEEEKNSKYVYRERNFGSFSRSFYVGDDLLADDIKAKLEDGVLNLSIPKKEKQKSQNKYIEIE